ncbi:CU044_5270 family protein [Streptomyces sp. NPDC014676]|uniref:CU044_5270 family protein n=1 Tax=Streptomyces sp. NPDC014676 TaxID=3364879 RepID=UPI0036F4F3DD
MNQLPELPERDLPPARHRLLKEHLMTEIRRDELTPARTRTRWLRPALIVGAVAAVTAVAVTVAVPSGRAEPAASEEAVALLEDIALAAEHADVPEDIRDDQFVYIRSRVGWSEQEGDGPAKLEPLHQREVWLSVDGSQQSMLHDPVVRADHELLEKQTPGIPSNSNYRHLQTLPTDPDEMFDWLQDNSSGHSSKAEATFALVGDLASESLMPPAQGAALYRAAAKIPGVFVIDDTVDAAGRHGVAVARVDAGERVELVFDRRTKELLGSREVAVEDLPWGYEKGEMTGRTAVLERAVVDERGERP